MNRNIEFASFIQTRKESKDTFIKRMGIYGGTWHSKFILLPTMLDGKMVYCQSIFCKYNMVIITSGEATGLAVAVFSNPQFAYDKEEVIFEKLKGSELHIYDTNK